MQGHAALRTLEYLIYNEETAPEYQQWKDRWGDWYERSDVWIWTTDGSRYGSLKPGFGQSEKKLGPELGFGWVIGEHMSEQVRHSHDQQPIAEQVPASSADLRSYGSQAASHSPSSGALAVRSVLLACQVLLHELSSDNTSRLPATLHPILRIGKRHQAPMVPPAPIMHPDKGKRQFIRIPSVEPGRGAYP